MSDNFIFIMIKFLKKLGVFIGMNFWFIIRVEKYDRRCCCNFVVLVVK